MMIKNRELWDKSLANNTDPYGACVHKFALQWADEMEHKMKQGKTLVECAEECSREVDKRPGMGITGFMYGAAVSILSECWEFGELLRRWHNIETQFGDEGVAANAKGTVLNPALLVIGSKQ